MSNRWYVRRDGQELGPFSDAGLRRFLESDQAQSGVSIRNGSAGEWLAPMQAGMVGTSSAAPVPAAVSPSNAPGGKPIDVVAPIESFPPTDRPTPFWSRGATWVAAGAGFLTLLSAACVGAWLLARHRNAERPAAASPAVNPSIAELEQETKRLREELADLQGRMRERERPSPEPAPAPAPFNLAEERAALANEIALEMARQEDLQERFNYEQGLLVDAADAGVDLPPYRSLRDERYFIRLPKIESELSKLDRAGLADRRAAFEQAASDRAKRIEQMQSQVREAVAALDVDLAGQTLKQYLPLVDGDDYDRGVKLLRQLGGAHVEKLLEFVRALPEDARQALAEGGPPPAALMGRFNDQELNLAVKTQLPQLASLAIAEEKYGKWNEVCEHGPLTMDLSLSRKLQFLKEAFALKTQGKLTAARAAELAKTFGVFRLEGEPSPADGILIAYPQDEAARQPFALFTAYREGAILHVLPKDLYAECRELADDAWPPDDRPHPLAGHWSGRANSHVYIDPMREEVAVIRRNEKQVQRICKIGPDYLVAYEFRSEPNETFADVFAAPGEHKEGELLPYSEFDSMDHVTLTLYLSAENGAKSLRMLRKQIAATALRGEMSTDDFWQKVGRVEEYSDSKQGFRRIDDKLQP
jgi:hypothetical protein